MPERHATELVLDDWLCDVVGHPCFRLAYPAAAQAAVLLKRLLEAARGGNAFAYAKLPTHDVAACSRLTQAGFDLVDTAVTLAWTGGENKQTGGYAVTEVMGSDYGQLPTVARRSFRLSRFHLDPLFPDDIADAIKEKWVESYCQGRRGDALYAARFDGRDAGFLAALATGEGAGRRAVIDLVGVAPEFRGRGLGRGLVMAFVDGWKSRAAELRVGTQAANIPSLRLYESCGFSIVETSYVLHAHVKNGAIIRC